MTTIEQIKQECRAIIALAGKATPGPWIARKMGLGDVYSAEHTWICSEPMDASIAAVRRGCGEVGAEKENAADAAFIAACRSFTPRAAQALLVLIRQLEDGDCEREIKELCATWEGSK